MKKTDKIISIQSRLVYGYVGSNVAELAIQMQGLDTIVFPTVLLSAHSGHQPMHGTAISKDLFDDLVQGIKEIDVLDSTACVTSGYIRTEELVDSIADFVKQIKSSYPNKTYVCDPVMGDIDTGLYIPENVAAKMISSLLPLCSYMTPNFFELQYITGREIATLEDLIAAVKNTPLLKGKTVVATSCHLVDTEDATIETILIDDNRVERIKTSKASIDTVGTGDLFTALFSTQLAKGTDAVDAVRVASAKISDILHYMEDKGLEEMNASCLLAAKLYEL
ncbi:pyridoxal kinase [Dysgonomonas massiliensis]|uniref:pyridoxal kinase n=1 Tax=Dysgonomonas massiliensis TaxID=2040292 RepID=UPI000C759F42|nr:pyridoxal kinase [Dysgonomonas massiliensis]